MCDFVWSYMIYILFGLTAIADAADVAAGKIQAIQCIACHGLDGNSSLPQYPNLNRKISAPIGFCGVAKSAKIGRKKYQGEKDGVSSPKKENVVRAKTSIP